MDVTIYIDVYHTGNLKHGTGTYSIVLEHIKDGEPKTKLHFRGLNNTTKHRTAIKACIDALNYMKKTCNIKIIINSPFVVNAINQSWDKTKNADLWQQLLDRQAQHNVTFEYELANTYSTYMFMTMKKAEIEYQNDNLIE